MPPKNYKKYKKIVGFPQSKSFDYQVKDSVEFIVIVESPSKCKKIEEYLGERYKCIATKGHIYCIPSLKSVDKKNNYKITYSKIKEKEEHIENMRQIISKFSPSAIIIASDDDREGTGIAYNICQEFNLPVDITKRIIFHEITKKAILNAIQNPQTIDVNMVNAQQARQVLDLLVGFKISPLLWRYLYFDKDNSLSAGRCQTPALRLVYDNEKEKLNNSIEKSYKIIGSFFAQNILFELETKKPITDENDVKQFLESSQNHKYKLTICPSTQTTRSPPRPFNTSNLLQVASNVLHLSPKQTMKYCQTLYQNGFITYMRTENTKYSPVFLKEIEEFIKTKWADNYCGDFENLANKDNGNPHEAIRVTKLDISDLNVTISDNTIEEDNEEKDDKENLDIKVKNKMLNSLYKLIWKNTVESCMSTATYETTKIHIDSPIETGVYVHIINKPIHLGWKIVDHVKEERDNQSSLSALLLYFNSLKNSKQPIKHNNINATISFHNKHSHYTESSLIKNLEELKIGRPSTFSALIETIQSRNYVKKMDIEGDKYNCKEFSLIDDKIVEQNIEKIIGNEKGKLVIQPLGITTIEFLIQHFNSLFSYDYTKIMEEKLDMIACPATDDPNMKEWFELCNDCSIEIDNSTKPISKQKYVIDEHHELVFEKFGPVIKYLLPSRSDENTIVTIDTAKITEKENEEDVENQSKKNKSLKTKKENTVKIEEKWEYKSVKKDLKLDLEKLRRREYTLDELLEPNNIYLGLWKGKEVHVKSGQYGNYIEYDGQRQNIKNVDKPIGDVKFDDVEVYLKAMSPLRIEENEISQPTDETIIKIYQNIHNKNILRVLNKDFSIRSGKFGPYIYYKKDNMAKPQFFNIRGFKEGFSVCDPNVLLEWIYMTYKLPRY